MVEIVWDEIHDTEQGRVFIGHHDMGPDLLEEARQDYIRLGNQYTDSLSRWRRMLKRLRKERDDALNAVEMERMLSLSTEALEGTW